MSTIKPVATEIKNTNTQNKKNSNAKKNQMAKDGVLVDNFIKDSGKNNFNEISNRLMIPEDIADINTSKSNVSQQSFSMKNALTPLLAGTAAIFGTSAILSSVLLKSSKTLNNSKVFEQLPDLARNMNIKQEPHFAVYRMLRDPSTKNIAGAAAVFIFSGLTLAAKNFVDGFKEIWVKKQQADIERDLQESLIDVETQSFAGKINVTNKLLHHNVNYFKQVLADTPSQVSFGKKESAASNKKDKKTDKDTALLLTSGLVTIAGCAAAGLFTFSNLRKSLNNANKYANKYTEAAINEIKNLSKAGGKNISEYENLFKVINAKPEFIQDTLKSTGFSASEIQKVTDNVYKSKKELFADAPTALGGIPQKIQYYCYLDENRGHLYNWVLNPENKFTKYIFLAFTAVSSIGYMVEQAFNAIKEVAVSKENAKTELNLKKRLVEVEINNFESKKKAAIAPLINDFNYKLKSGKSPEELQASAENILTEIKNGPPYIFG